MERKKHDGVYFFWSASIVICMLVAIFVLGFSSCNKGADAPKASPTASPEASDSAASPSPNGTNEPSVVTTPTANSTETRLAETADMGQEYVDKFVFLGDSTTYGLGYYDVVDVNQVWTPVSGTLTLNLWSTATIDYHDGTEISIKDALTATQPEYIMITLGVNGISFMDEQYFITEYTNLVLAVKEASPNTKIILNSIYPVSASYPTENGITNEKIDTANIWVERIASSTGVKFLDSESVIKDSNGAMPDSLSNDKALHLNADGCKLVINYLRTHGYK
ncbi:MAG: SGNH/GDSL hydrolase family protein [Oscillospiraceae bacterium]|nr:SGNH/GDSL hydrolase family protein [Oscillospiraceae bacterium]